MAVITDTNTVLHNVSTKNTVRIADIIEQIKNTSLVKTYDEQTLNVLQPGDADWADGQIVTVNISFEFNSP